MQYMGGKAKIARRLVNAILADTDARNVWYEPFVGGANITVHAAPHFTASICTDVHPDLILMWQYVTTGGMLPPHVTRQRYHELRHAPPSWERGYIGFGASFGGKWFGGYGVSNRWGENWRISERAINRQAAILTKAGTQFRHAPFGDITPPPGAVVYCDPPYRGTTGYAADTFDHDAFYTTLREWAPDRHVYLSGYDIPAGTPARLVWSTERRLLLDGDTNTRSVVENLYRIGGNTR